jgi:hypothetical protein
MVYFAREEGREKRERERFGVDSGLERTGPWNGTCRRREENVEESGIEAMGVRVEKNCVRELDVEGHYLKHTRKLTHTETYRHTTCIYIDTHRWRRQTRRRLKIKGPGHRKLHSGSRSFLRGKSI